MSPATCARSLLPGPLPSSTDHSSTPCYVSQLIAGFGRPDLNLRMQVLDFIDAGVAQSNKDRTNRLI